jgi:hypothetical protein
VYDPRFDCFLPNNSLDFFRQAIERGFSAGLPAEGGEIVGHFRS